MNTCVSGDSNSPAQTIMAGVRDEASAEKKMSAQAKLSRQSKSYAQSIPAAQAKISTHSKAAAQIARANQHKSRFPNASLGMLIWLTLVWVLLWGEFNTQNVVSGFLLALLITTLAPFPVAPFDGRFRPWGVARLIWFFCADLLKASFIQARFILSGKTPHGGIIRVQLRSHSDVYLAMVAGITGLVPGSVVVDAHRATGMLYVHVFDTQLAGGVAGVHRVVLEQEERVLRAFASHDELIDAGYVPGADPKLGRLPRPYAPVTGPALMHYGVYAVPEIIENGSALLERIAGNKLQGEMKPKQEFNLQEMN